MTRDEFLPKFDEVLRDARLPDAGQESMRVYLDALLAAERAKALEEATALCDKSEASAREAWLAENKDADIGAANAARVLAFCIRALAEEARRGCQTAVAAVGADGPCNAEDAVARLVAALDAAEARARDMERERDRWRENYMTVADAVAASSTSPEHLAAQARETRDQRDAAQARVRHLEAALRYCDKKLSDVNAAHPSFYVLDALNIIDAALADGADKGEEMP